MSLGPNRSQRWPLAVVGGLAAAWALPAAAYAELGRYTRYMADDYCMGYLARVTGFLGAQRYWYVEWSGRYAYTFLVGLSELFPGGLIPALPALVLVAWYGALAWALAGLPLVAENGLRRALALLGSGFVLALTLLATPNVTQSVYWRGGVLTYCAPVVFGLLLAGTLLRVSTTDAPRRAWLGYAYAAIALLAFAGAGFAEVYGVVQAGALALALAAVLAFGALATRRRWLGPLGVTLAATLLGLLAVALAPGTRLRQAGLPPPPTLSAIIHNSLVYTGWFLRDAAQQHGGLWLLTVGAPALVAFGLGSRVNPPGRRWLGLALLPVALLALLVAAYAVIFYALQYLPPERVLVVQWAVVLLLSAGWGWLAGEALAATRLGAGYTALPRAARMTAVGLVTAALLALPLAQVAGAQELRAERRNYATNWGLFDQHMRAQPTDAGVVTVARLDNLGHLDSLSDDPAFWTNHCAGLYYGHDIRAIAPPPAATEAKLAAATPVDGQLGEVAQIVGVRLEPAAVQAGAPLTVTIYWLPLAPTEKPYTVFVHLLGAGGSLAQVDAYPGGGAYPTTRWLVGRPFADTYVLTVPADAPSGPTRVIVGLYDIESLERLLASGAAANAAGEAWLEVGTVTVER